MNEEVDTMIQLKVLGHQDWKEDQVLKNIDHTLNTDGAFLSVPGPTSFPVRPHLEPVVSKQQVAARFVDGAGKVAPVVMVLAQGEIKTFTLPFVPLAIEVRSDAKLWVLSETALVICNFQGEIVKTILLKGETLIAGKDDAVWITMVHGSKACYMSKEGQTQGTYLWDFGMKTCRGFDGGLYKVKRDKIQHLSPKGETNEIALSTPIGHFENLLWFDSQWFITTSGAEFKRYSREGLLLKKITVQSIGLSDKAEVFMAGREGSQVQVWFSSGKTQRLPLTSTLPKLGAFTVVGIKEGKALVYGQDYAAWYEDNQLTKSFEVSNQNYLSDIFPLRWELAQAHTIATAEGKLILSASSAKGMTLFEVTW